MWRRARSGMDRVEIRRTNFIPTNAFPYQTPVALQYDSGDYQTTLDKALIGADYAGFEARRAEAKAAASCAASASRPTSRPAASRPPPWSARSAPAPGFMRCGTIRVHPTGSVTVLTGTHSHGQGHETTFAQLVADRLGMPVAKVDVVHGDTAKIPFGMGTYGSRSLAVGGSAHGQGDGQDRHKATQDRRPSDGGLGRATSSSTAATSPSPAPTRPSRSGEIALTAYVPAQLSDRGTGAGPRGDRLLRPEELHLSGRLPHLRGRDRSRDGPGQRW